MRVLIYLKVLNLKKGETREYISSPLFSQIALSFSPFFILEMGRYHTIEKRGD